MNALFARAKKKSQQLTYLKALSAYIKIQHVSHEMLSARVNKVIAQFYFRGYFV